MTDVASYEQLYNAFLLGYLHRVHLFAIDVSERPEEARREPGDPALRDAARDLVDELDRWHRENPAAAGMAEPLLPGNFPLPEGSVPSPAYGRLRRSEEKWRGRLEAVADGAPIAVLLEGTDDEPEEPLDEPQEPLE